MKCSYCSYETDGIVELEHSECECLAMQIQEKEAHRARVWQGILDATEEWGPTLGAFDLHRELRDEIAGLTARLNSLGEKERGNAE